jgi:protein-L-isoaspartate(D-aspartate) O-methyltransferase
MAQIPPKQGESQQERFVERDNDGKLTWKRPRFPERQRERDRMVNEQFANPGPGAEPVRDERVLAAMRVVPRHRFVPEERRDQAYADCALPIGHEQTISQPYIVAYMTELLAVKPGDKVLEVGTGSGYQAAVLSELTPRVFSIEIVEPLFVRTEALLKELGYSTIKTRLGDGYKGWTEEAPFDSIIVTCGADEVPGPLWEQLKVGGRMVIPVGATGESQRLQVVMKREDGTKETKTVLPVRFVPMTGESQKK